MKKKNLFKHTAIYVLLCTICVFLYSHTYFLTPKTNVGGSIETNFYSDRDGDGFGNPLNSMKASKAPKGYVADNSDCNDRNVTVHPGAPELCDGKDNNCNGIIDEDCGITDLTGKKKCHCDDPQDYYADADGDGYGDEGDVITACEAPDGYVDIAGDCDDGNAEVNPDAAELCDGIDNDCDDLFDDDDPDVFYKYVYFADNDEDGFGDAYNELLTCDDTPPDGYVENYDDCDDTDPTITIANYWYYDFDNDGFGDESIYIYECQQPEGFVDNPYDCDDTDPTITIAAYWYYDFDNDGFGDESIYLYECQQPEGYVDNPYDCDDTDPTITIANYWYYDFDNDGFGDEFIYIYECQQREGYVDNPNDCDDADPNITLPTIWYQDADNDTYGNKSVFTYACKAPELYVKNKDDCNDNNPNIHPGAEEICDRIDNNCNDRVDEETPPPIISSPNFDLCDGPVTLSVFDPVAGLNYQWFKAGRGAIPGATGTTYTATRKGTYWVLAYLNQLCRKVSNTQTVFNSCGRSAIPSNETSSSASSISNDNISLYPNPSSGNITINYNSNRTDKIQLKVYDITGRVVYTSSEQAIKGNNTYKLALSNLVSGMYYLELNNGSNQSRTKFVIEK